MRRTTLLAILTSAACSGCVDDEKGVENAGPFHELQYRRASNPPGVADLLPQAIRIQQGIAVKARISALDERGQPLPVLDLESRDPTIFVSERGPTLGSYVMYGVEPGDTELRVTSRGVLEATVPVTVISPAD